MRHNLFFLLLALLCFNVKTGMATGYHVSNSGNDNNSGLSLTNAFVTIQHAADVVVAGDTVFVHPGNYVGFDDRMNSGTASAPIVFLSIDRGAHITQRGAKREDGINIEGINHIVIDGFVVNNMGGAGNGIRLVNANNCAVRNCSCDKNAMRAIFTGFTDDILIENNVCSGSLKEHGIYVSNSGDRPVIRYNECFNNKATGIHMNGDISQGGDGIISDAQVYGNFLHDNNGASGINMDGVVGAKIYNNVIWNNHNAQGVALFQQDGGDVTHNILIYNNTIVVPTDGRWGILVMEGANEGTEILNNVIINQHAWRGCITVEDTTRFKSDYNVLQNKMSFTGDGSAIDLKSWKAGGYDGNSVLVSDTDFPDLFTDLANGDLSPTKKSPTVDAGTNSVLAVVKEDFIFVQRGVLGDQLDIGAWEIITSLSTEKIHSERLFKIYPNPATDVIYARGVSEYTILDLNGKAILSGSALFGIDVSTLVPGFYFLSANGIKCSFIKVEN
ncbi:MAG: T9SS type A sorting domain-containing protein [Bacteroidetes bacterium]|nr:T9SS type A sorting domain-containing protein [Bacteroidota bacterium]